LTSVRIATASQTTGTSITIDRIRLITKLYPLRTKFRSLHWSQKT